MRVASNIGKYEVLDEISILIYERTRCKSCSESLVPAFPRVSIDKRNSNAIPSLF